MRLGFVTALTDEARTLGAAYDDRASGHLVEIAGPGVDNAARAARHLVDRDVDGLVSWGTAGALNPDHRPGALIVYDAAVSAAGLRYACDEAWYKALAHSLNALDPTIGTGLTAEHAIAAAVEKAALGERFGCAAIDMESSAVGECAAAAGIPFAALRAVVDPLDFDIPRAALLALEHGGQPRILPVLGALLHRPQATPALLKLARWYRLSLARLRLAAHALEPDFGAG